MERTEALVKEIKRLMETEELNSTELDEMARKAFNNILTKEGKEKITSAVKQMIQEEKDGKVKHSDNFYFKTLAALAKKKIGEAITTTELQKAAGVKHPQPMNKLLAKLVEAKYITRESSHVEPEKGEPKQKGRPKGEEKPKVEKSPKLGGLFSKEKEEAEDTVSENEEMETKGSYDDGYEDGYKKGFEDGRLAESHSLNEDGSLNPNKVNKAAIDKKSKGYYEPEGYDKANPKTALKVLDKDSEEYYEENELSEAEKELSEINLMSLEKEFITKFGADGNKGGGIEESEEPLNESLLRMQKTAGIISDFEYTRKVSLLK